MWIYHWQHDTLLLFNHYFGCADLMTPSRWFGPTLCWADRLLQVGQGRAEAGGTEPLLTCKMNQLGWCDGGSFGLKHLPSLKPSFTSQMGPMEVFFLSTEPSFALLSAA